MSINFVLTEGKYKEVVASFINPIKRYLDNATVGEPVKGKLNFCMFTEDPAELHVSVLMSHGIADKNYLRKMKKQRAKKFSHVLVSGPEYKKALEEKYDFDSIEVVGYPKLDYIFEGKFKKRIGKKKRILWMPTHNTIQAVSTFPAFSLYLPRFPNELEILSSAHPACRDKHHPTMQDLADADVIIADAGSSIYEAWALGKPVIFPDWLVKDGVCNYFDGSFEHEIYKKKLGYHAGNFNELVEMCMSPLTVQDDVKEFMEGIFPKNLRGVSGKKTAEVLKELNKKHFG